MRDPLHQPGAANVGSAGLGRNAPTNTRWELGVVVSYNSATHTSLVRTNSGRPLRDVPQMKSTSGAFDHLETGTNVVVSWDLGIPVIIGCIDFVGAPQAAIPPPSVTGVEGYGDADPTQDTTGGNNYKAPTAPTDASGGDWGQMGSLGNHVAVLSGGMTSMGSPTALIRSFGISGTIQHIAKRLEAITDFGKWRVENVEGRTSFILRAGSTQATETGQDEQHWTIQLDLGATGDILDFKITDPMGKLLFRLHAGGDGRVQIYGDGGVDISSGSQGAAEVRQDIAGQRVVGVARDDKVAVQGNHEAVVDGNSTTEIAGDAQRVIGGADVAVVGGDSARSVGGDAANVVTGNQATTVGKDVTATVKGKVETTINGKLLASVAQNVDLIAKGKATLSGSHVNLGNGGHPLPLFDVFLQDLSEFVNALIGAIGNLTPSNPFGLAAQVVLLQKFAILTAQGFPYQSRKVSNE